MPGDTLGRRPILPPWWRLCWSVTLSAATCFLGRGVGARGRTPTLGKAFANSENPGTTQHSTSGVRDALSQLVPCKKETSAPLEGEMSHFTTDGPKSAGPCPEISQSSQPSAPLGPWLLPASLAGPGSRPGPHTKGLHRPGLTHRETGDRPLGLLQPGHPGTALSHVGSCGCTASSQRWALRLG